MRQAGEPSVEEILDSIKKVIARDNRADAAEQRSRRESAVPLSPAPAAEAEVEDVLDLNESAALVEEPVFEDPDFEDDSFENQGRFDDEADSPEAPLLTEGVRGSMRDSLAALAMLAQPGVPPQIVRSGETSLEGLVRELLRPSLGEWLDKNLPQMVERMVADEIARIVGKKG